MDLTTLAATITALGVIFGAIFAAYKWFLKQEKQDRDIKAIKEELTPRQREVLTLYYAGGKSAHEIAELLEVCPSTVFRTLKRAEKRLFRCLRFGAESYLLGMEEES